jgi:2-dehydro-3-deoxyphosphogluconate aldolase / (4S)-4-hydroxy-2-oxoglutarate aldolase
VTARLDNSAFGEWLRRSPVMVILRGAEGDDAVQLAQRAWDLGAELIEIPLQTDANVAALEAVAAAARSAGRIVGAGTVTSIPLVRRAHAVGAAFTVAPGLDEEVATASHGQGMPHLPGVGTATEIHHSLRLGMTWLKAFPASLLTPGWMTAMLGPFPDARFVATGGISATNAAAFLAAGAGAVALGTSFATTADEQLRALFAG